MTAVARPTPSSPAASGSSALSVGLENARPTERRPASPTSAHGVSTKLIAAQLGISVHTARNHVQNIIRKCDAHSKLEAVSMALREGVIQTPTS